MSKVIFSPHTDDAIFSLASLIEKESDFTIASVFAGIPSDDVGKKKHTILRNEHSIACLNLNVKEINHDLLDDVYGMQNIKDVDKFIINILNNFNEIYFPIGIYHADHMLLHERIMYQVQFYDKSFYLYTEHPYKLMFPEIYQKRINDLNIKNPQIIKCSKNKKFFVKEYKSQIGTNKEVVKFLLTDEEIWKIK